MIYTLLVRKVKTRFRCDIQYRIRPAKTRHRICDGLILTMLKTWNRKHGDQRVFSI